jgi:hypothetical protein
LELGRSETPQRHGLRIEEHTWVMSPEEARMDAGQVKTNTLCRLHHWLPNLHRPFGRTVKTSFFIVVVFVCLLRHSLSL